MADKKISQLGAAATIVDANLLAIVQSGVTKKITFANLKAAIISDASLNLSQVLDNGNTTGGNNIVVSANDLIKSSAANKSQIDFGASGNELLATVDGGSQSKGWIQLTQTEAYLGFQGKSVLVNSDSIVLDPGGLSTNYVVLQQNLLRSNAAGEAQLAFGSHSAIMSTDGGANAESLMEITSNSATLSCLGNQFSVTSGQSTISHDTLIIFNSPVYNFNAATASTVPYFDAFSNLVSSAITPTELGYLTGATSAIQAQIDALVTGLTWKTAVRVATTAAGTLATSFENGDTVDGVVLATGDRILIKNQASATENGIYTVNASGAPTRALDMNSGAEFPSATVAVSEGTVNQDTQWVCNNDNPVTIGVTNISFVAVGGTTYVGTTNRVTVTGNVIDISATFEALLGKVANPLSQFAATTSAQLAGVISDETGSGALVFGTSPTFTTNITAPLIIGGTGVTDKVSVKATSGNGTPTAIGFDVLVGNNGATTAMKIYNSGIVNIGAASATNQRLLRVGTASHWVDIGDATNNGSAAIFLDQSTPSTSNYAIAGEQGTGSMYLNATNNVRIRINGVATDLINVAANQVSFAAVAPTSGVLTPFLFTTPAATGQTAGTETVGFDFNASATITHASNTIIPTNRDVRFQARTHAFASSGGVITDPATVSISGAPIAGTNCTLTNPMALWVQSGLTHLAGGLLVDASVKNNGSGIKHSRVTTGSVGAGSTALVTITWATAFADANYTVSASVVDATTSSLSLSVVHVESVSAGSVTVRVINNAVGSLTGIVHVIAMHD